MENEFKDMRRMINYRNQLRGTRSFLPASFPVVIPGLSFGAPAKAKMTKEEKAAMMKPKKDNKKKLQTLSQSTFVNTTPEGDKKDTSEPMANAYDPKAVESAWYSWWKKQGYFTPSAKDAVDRPHTEKFTMVIPPPNVTGSLHLGHALTNSIEDALARWHRMQGHITMWLPGVDHAGISTQSVVEKQLAKEEGLTRHDLGREKFVEKVWEWKHKYANRIQYQTARMGASVDWTREAFTMDENLSRGVVESFVRMRDMGLIYRGNRLVNWCVTLRTAISDLEVEYISVDTPTKLRVPGYDKPVMFGMLTKFAYKVKDSDEEIVVATTRLETMLGDVAVAVHSKDKRYAHLIGKQLVHPYAPDRKVVVISDDELVDPEFGTGAVKITPAHDPNDFKSGVKNNLEKINIFTEDGLVNQLGGKFKDLPRFEAREALRTDLESLGLLRGDEPNPMRIGLCSRSKDIIEPMIKPQWWVKCDDLAARAVSAVRNGDLKLIPEHHEKTWYNWLENIQDWCISRQLWWGHRCPAYLVTIEGVLDTPNECEDDHWVVGRNQEEALENAAKKWGVSKDKITLSQDPDVLDTWYSSGLFPMSTFGWPNEENEDFKAFFPGHLLETGHDILFFWVARMVMMSLCFTDKLPFKTVYLHALVRDAQGRKMSKSLGNVVDPLEVIDGVDLDALLEKLRQGNLDPKEIARAEKDKKGEFPDGIPICGADALRFGLLAYCIQGRNINLDIKRIIGYRTFGNKIWNGFKFSMMQFGEGYKPDLDLKSQKLSFMDKWIMHRLHETIKTSNVGFTEFVFGDIANALHSFWINDLCGNYIEAIKPAMNGTDAAQKKAAQDTLYTVIYTTLRLLHPLMPFITEELYQRLPRHDCLKESICVEDFPIADDAWVDASMDTKFDNLFNVIKGIRSFATYINLPKGQKPPTFIRSQDAEVSDICKTEAEVLATLASVGKVTVLAETETVPEGCLFSVVDEKSEVHLQVKGMVNIQAEVDKLKKKLGQLQKMRDTLVKKTKIPNYEDKVPADVRAKNQEKIETNQGEIEASETAISNLSKLL